MNEVMRRLLDLPDQASSIARQIDHLHFIVIGTAFAVAFLSFLAITVLLVRFRDRPGPRATTKKIPLRIEIAAAAFTLAVFIAFWLAGFTQYRELREPSPDALRVYVVAKQWMWSFVYADGTAAQDDLRVPVGRPIETLMTSRDVIHSFYVPAFRLKQDVVPGRITTMEFTATEPGEYDIQCAEYCGAGHSRMRGRVIAMAPADYARWVADHPAPDLATVGERAAAAHGCFRCHTIDGTFHLGPSWKGLYGSRIPLVGGGFVTADDAYLTESMMDPLVKIHAGYAPIMPSFQGQLTAPEAAAIVEFIRSLRGNP
jgi:cytochrome c oxidase subunit II